MKVALLLALLGLTAGQEPSKCCTDYQFEVIMGQVGGSVYNEKGHLTQNWIDGYNVVHYDGFNNMVAVESHQNLANGTTVVIDVLLDYNNKIEYVQNNGQCWHLPLTKKIRSPCIPATAKYIGDTYMGYGSSRLRLHNWEYHPDHTDQSLKVAVTEHGCTPVVESYIGHSPSKDGKQMIEANFVYIFNGYKPNIRKTSIFNIPQNCQPHPDPVAVGRSVREVHTMFSEDI